MRTVFACLALAASLARGQTVTTTDANGDSIVELITVNPAGLPSTTILQTLVAAIPTQPDVQQGPVGQPPVTTGNAVTAYIYTTTDAEGDTTVVHDTFTPSFTSAVASPTLSLTGTILDYSAWLSMVGTNTVAANNGALERWTVSSRVFGMSAGVVAGVLGGVWLVVA